MSDEILTGEGVLLDVRPAGVLTRIGAQLLDLIAYGALFFLFSFVVGVLSPNLDAAAISALVLGAVVTIIAILPTLVETLSRGKSLGKAAAGIRIVRDDGGPIRFRHAFVRALTGVVEIWMSFGSIAFITSMLNKRGKRVGDFLAGTYAVRDRAVPYASPPLLMPSPLAAWARSADIGRLPDGLALATRQFLGRLPDLAPASRAALGLELAAQLERYVSPPPPLGTPPEAYLQAVIVAHRDRAYAAELRRQSGASKLALTVRTLPHQIPDPPN